MSKRSDAPLGDVTVVSLATNLPGPVAAARLASLGASVTKVEPPAGDQLKVVAPSWYEELVVGQHVVTLDLKDPVGSSSLAALIADADVVLTAMRPSALARLGLTEIVERHGVVLVEIVGYDGDRADEAGHDLTYQAVQGTVHAPELPLVPVVDLLGAERAVNAALVGLRRRDRSGAGAHLRVILDDLAWHASAAVRHGLTGPGTVLGGGLPTYGMYATTDGYVAVAALEPHFAERLTAAVGQTREELAARFATKPSAHWESLGRSLDIPVVAVHEPRTVAVHEPRTVAVHEPRTVAASDA
ncbi:MAG: CoA transferase [Intrasporangium sp.]|uniref:CoA transferase n=1 Tax=Intrasporangium sp. TaxID=1925024 RepID=UPI00264771E8|nr:CoA transferase [Intrasporangium sp.]MDN5795758.1 CoA transferase [Intrasporangium sp.]